uniref:EF-hand domain-containing protein n=1 Tax=Pyramimonas obovata TaxID=1411642 RepID=A0A7S0RE80_9CHLO|mmetsp:Transcript_31964/g.69792  ORF Transcript_31964/g.69792 Transcript_31964/m.69792 type:complete len:576 (+) Transcript_31964:225-1952(+)
MDSWLLYRLNKEGETGENGRVEQSVTVKTRKSRKPELKGFFLSTTLSNMGLDLSKWGGTSDVPAVISKPKFSLPGLLQSAAEHPSRFHLLAVQEFFRYTEYQGRLFFNELDEDGDGRLKIDDLKRAMRSRNLPESYAHSFMRRAKRNHFTNSIGWEEFRAVMGMKESSMLRTFNSMNLTLGGAVRTKQIKASLDKLGLEATDKNAEAMMRFLGKSPEGYISYGSFRNFLMLLPREHEYDSAEASAAWYEAATFVPIAPPATQGGGGKALAIAALAGGLASGSTTFTMHPLDTIKTKVQASVGKINVKELVNTWNTLGPTGLYRGFIPATMGAALAHGIRTGTYELVQKVLAPVHEGGGPITELQVQGFASGVGTLFGTAVRIPHEVLKQRLQCGQYDNVRAALGGVLASEGPRGLFRGTAATVGREVPFYVIGIVAFEQLKTAARAVKRRTSDGEPLASWETLMLGAMSGAIAAALTTPADVLKTRTMTGAVPLGMSVWGAVRTISQKEGPLALFKGCIPRACWVAPLGAMNFAGYELAKNAMEKELGEDADAASGEELLVAGTPSMSEALTTPQ